MSCSSSATEDSWHCQEIIDYFRSDKEIAEAISAEEFTELINYDKYFVEAVKTAVGYPHNGKDSKLDSSRLIISQLVKNRASYMSREPADLKWELSGPEHGDKSSCHSNKETLAADMHFLIAVFFTLRGDINTIIRKVSGSVKYILSMLQDKYVIKDSGTSLGPKDITLARIVRAFPVICVIMFHKNAVQEVVPYDTFPGSEKPETHAICYPLLQSVCPFTLKAEHENNFHPVMLWVRIKWDDIRHKQDGKKTTIISILRHYRACYTSTVTPENARLKIFLKIGIIIQEETGSSQKWKLTDSAAKLARNCLSDLENMRTEDENHVQLMKLAKSGKF